MALYGFADERKYPTEKLKKEQDRVELALLIAKDNGQQPGLVKNLQNELKNIQAELGFRVRSKVLTRG